MANLLVKAVYLLFNQLHCLLAIKPAKVLGTNCVQSLLQEAVPPPVPQEAIQICSVVEGPVKYD